MDNSVVPPRTINIANKRRAMFCDVRLQVFPDL